MMSERNAKSNVDGYIHNISPINTAKSGNRYFDFTIQENEEERRVVCFSPEKISTLKTKEERKLSVRLVNVSPQKRRYEPDSTEYTMGKYSRVEEPKNLSFEWKTCNSGHESNTVLSVEEVISSVNSGETVTVKGKVLFKSQTQTVFSGRQNKELKKCDVILADASSPVVVTVWEDKISEIQEGGSYLVVESRVNFFNQKYLNVTKNTRLQSIEENLELPAEILTAAEALKLKPKSTNHFVGIILGVDVTRSFICVNCKLRIKEENVGAGAVVKCGLCNINMLKLTTKALVTASLLVGTDSGEHAGRYLCPMEALTSFFQECENITEKDVSKLSADLITETLLLVGTVEFRVLAEKKIIQGMKKTLNSSNSETLE